MTAMAPASFSHLSCTRAGSQKVSLTLRCGLMNPRIIDASIVPWFRVRIEKAADTTKTTAAQTAH